ncbi:hypothetical protein B484DRAFT_450707 [Ochromonadaceae sp. CCMP2298]|nr:hypothetical protein B484DRAFT_450707 [Ochromonadaceae sp. CCMP2298]|mmetsp:Transcript_10424/g.23091  ORF Transcript_10424/g.23091 Transcript_10424/m.23091 type:complete len:1508 (+) Transcript_10424:156-4679(+)
MDELENDVLPVLLLLDDNLFPQLLEWASSQGWADLVLYLLETDVLRFKSNGRLELDDSHLSMHQPFYLIEKNSQGCFDPFLSPPKLAAVRRLIASGVPLNSIYAQVCNSIWREMLHRGNQIMQCSIWPTVRRFIVEGHEIGILDMLSDTSQRKYFERFIQRDASDLASLQCLISVRRILEKLERFKNHQLDAPDRTPSPTPTANSNSPSRSPSLMRRWRASKNAVISASKALQAPFAPSSHTTPAADRNSQNNEYTDPFEAFKIVLEGTRSLQKQFFPTSSNFGGFGGSGRDNPNSADSFYGGAGFNGSSDDYDEYSGGTGSRGYGGRLSHNTPRNCSGLSEALRIEIQSTLTVNASVRAREIETVDRAFAFACANMFERQLLALEKEMLAYISVIFEDFVTTNDYVLMVAYARAQQCQRITDYYSKLEFLYDRVRQQKTVSWKDPYTRGQVYIAYERISDEKDASDSDDGSGADKVPPPVPSHTVPPLADKATQRANVTAISLEILLPHTIPLSASTVAMCPRRVTVYAAAGGRKASKKRSGAADSVKQGVPPVSASGSFSGSTPSSVSGENELEDASELYVPPAGIFGRGVTSGVRHHRSQSLNLAALEVDAGALARSLMEDTEEDTISDLPPTGRLRRRQTSHTANPIEKIEVIEEEASASEYSDSSDYDGDVQEIRSTVDLFMLDPPTHFSQRRELQDSFYSSKSNAASAKSQFSKNRQDLDAETRKLVAIDLKKLETTMKRDVLGLSKSKMFSPAGKKVSARDLAASLAVALASTVGDEDAFARKFAVPVEESFSFLADAEGLELLHGLLFSAKQARYAHSLEQYVDSFQRVTSHDASDPKSRFHVSIHITSQTLSSAEGAQLKQVYQQQRSESGAVMAKMPMPKGPARYQPTYSRIFLGVSFSPVSCEHSMINTLQALSATACRSLQDFGLGSGGPSFASVACASAGTKMRIAPAPFKLKALDFFADFSYAGNSLKQDGGGGGAGGEGWGQTGHAEALYDLYLGTHPYAGYEGSGAGTGCSFEEKSPSGDEVPAPPPPRTLCEPITKHLGVCDFSLCEVLSTLSTRLMMQILMLVMVDRPVILLSTSSTLLTKLQLAMPRLIWPFRIHDSHVVRQILSASEFARFVSKQDTPSEQDLPAPKEAKAHKRSSSWIDVINKMANNMGNMGGSYQRNPRSPGQHGRLHKRSNSTDSDYPIPAPSFRRIDTPPALHPVRNKRPQADENSHILGLSSGVFYNASPDLREALDGMRIRGSGFTIIDIDLGVTLNRMQDDMDEEGLAYKPLPSRLSDPELFRCANFGIFRSLVKSVHRVNEDYANVTGELLARSVHLSSSETCTLIPQITTNIASSNREIEKVFYIFWSEMILRAIPKRIQHFPGPKVISCDIRGVLTELLHTVVASSMHMDIGDDMEGHHTRADFAPQTRASHGSHGSKKIPSEPNEMYAKMNKLSFEEFLAVFVEQVADHGESNLCYAFYKEFVADGSVVFRNLLMRHSVVLEQWSL